MEIAMRLHLSKIRSTLSHYQRVMQEKIKGDVGLKTFKTYQRPPITSTIE